MTIGQIIEHVALTAFGAALVLSVLISALETVVLPRGGFTRLGRFVFAMVGYASWYESGGTRLAATT